MQVMWLSFFVNRLPCRPSLQVVGPRNSPSVLVGSSGSRRLGSPLNHNTQLPVVVVTALCYSAVDSTLRAVDQLGCSTQGCCSYRATGL